MDRIKVFEAYQKEAETLLKEGGVGPPIFSRGTYQFEVQEKGKKKEFPFLQLKDDGEVTDSFCSCSISEKGAGCPHLAAGYLRIFNGFSEPLHVRFQKSLWSRLFQMASHHSDLTKEKEGRYVFKNLFSIEASSKEAEKQLKKIIEDRPIETEETSIKFSNLSPDEIRRYREGKPSSSLQFELSFWSDLGKWVMALQDEKEPYQIQFKGTPLPSQIEIAFRDVAVSCAISEKEWPALIPSLNSVDAPLKVFDLDDELIQGAEYDEIKHCIRLRRNATDLSLDSSIQIDGWSYVEGKGFYRHHADPLLQGDLIPADKIGAALSSKILRKFLTISEEARNCQYRLIFDGRGNLHIQLYVFVPTDLRGDRAACFPPWVYLPDTGFIRLNDWLFEGNERMIPKEQVADFVNRHRSWLHNFPGFQAHLGSIESHLVYSLKQDELSFEAELNDPEKGAEALHFDEWVYIRGQGFYMKKEGRGRLPLHPGLKLQKEEISPFIAAHKEELEQVHGFFNSESAIRNIGLHIRLNREGLISISPTVEYASNINPETVKMFGSYAYVEGKGFSEIPPASRLPDRYREKMIIPHSQETAFLAYELEPLKPFVIDLDPRLEKPQNLRLKVEKITRDKKKPGREWLVDLSYESDAGKIDIFTIWDAMQNRKRHLFSPAGLFSLKEARFNWIQQLKKKRLDRKRRLIRLNTLEWMRLTVFEEVEKPKGSDGESVQTRKSLEELDRLETHRLLDISRLKATLRPYQEEGLRWLWFLYCHGLSGLLCDDMGLGKTHQTMALLAAVINEDEEKKNKYFVVCPTSVIYHWQELLKRFLPEMRVCTYYGLERNVEDFETSYDILLTSYGILRQGKEELKRFHFEVAIFDEIQVAKNHASQTYRALRMIQCQMRLGLTGTPIENRIRELKSLLDIVLPSYMPSDPVFRELFINPIEKYKDEEKKALLGKLVKPFILRRKKKDVLTDLPEKIEEIAYCDLSDEQRQLYKQVALQMRDTVYRDLKQNQKSVSFVHVFSALSQLKRICDHPALVEETTKYQAHSSGKWDLFIELLTEALSSGQKIVVFSQYLGMLDLIETYLKKKGIGFASIKGVTKDRAEQLRRFREDPDCVVFVASLLAAGVGIDLTVASIVIHYDRWWNPAKENQATDRVHRIGQNRGVQVFKLVTKHTIEEHIHEMIEKKQGLLEDIIGQEDQINYLSREELLYVFEKMFKDVEE